jgi:plastocyanin
MLREAVTRKRLAAAALAAWLALGAAGCSGGAAPVTVRGGRVAITLDDYSITPQRLRAAPGRIAFAIVNHGAVGHTFHVLRGRHEVVTGATILPGRGAQESGTFTRGEYKLVCILGNHEDLGMYGTLVVR